MTRVGDLGRRVAERRQELGLSSADLAERAGMDTHYIESLERSPAPQLPRAALWRLAAALELSVDSLTGSGLLEPPGQGPPPPVGLPVLEPLTAAECYSLVNGGGVGRVVFVDARGPVAQPVNFGLVAGNVVFRTEPNAAVLDHLGTPVAFEVDHIDEALFEGWSVLVRGTGRVVEDPADRDRALSSATPWAAGHRTTVVTITDGQWTGRRIRRRSPGDS
jgi:nitroimidazol reductase NimA-like FMN-containing flavoprotein (pyridoxamine 5'-phosphate oxidase superfamily)